MLQMWVGGKGKLVHIIKREEKTYREGGKSLFKAPIKSPTEFVALKSTSVSLRYMRVLRTDLNIR